MIVFVSLCHFFSSHILRSAVMSFNLGAWGSGGGRLMLLVWTDPFLVSNLRTTSFSCWGLHSCIRISSCLELGHDFILNCVPNIPLLLRTTLLLPTPHLPPPPSCTWISVHTGIMRMLVCLYKHVEDRCHFLRAVPACFYANLMQARMGLEEGSSVEKNFPHQEFQAIAIHDWCGWAQLTGEGGWCWPL